MNFLQFHGDSPPGWGLGSLSSALNFYVYPGGIFAGGGDFKNLGGAGGGMWQGVRRWPGLFSQNDVLAPGESNNVVLKVRRRCPNAIQ